MESSNADTLTLELALLRPFEDIVEKAQIGIRRAGKAPEQSSAPLDAASQALHNAADRALSRIRPILDQRIQSSGGTAQLVDVVNRDGKQPFSVHDP
jgi:hypothetical protein